MRMTKPVVLAAIGCLSSAVLTFGQVGTPVDKLDPEKEVKIAHYRKVLEEIRREIEEVRFVLGEHGVGGTGKLPGDARLADLSKRISQKKDEFDESKRMISRGESKQKVIKMSIVRIETDLGRSLKQMPNDPVAQALQKLVEIDDSVSARMKKKFDAGQISADELSNSERKLAESRLQLAKHQWEESAESRKALAAANSALEAAVLEREIQAHEMAELAKEIQSLKGERGRVEAFLQEETELSLRAADVEHLISVIRNGSTEAATELIDRLRIQGVKIYEPGNQGGKSADPKKTEEK